MTDVTLAILAGGAGSRMGRPKAELRVGGKPILAYLLDRFAWPGPTLLVTAPGREQPPGAERFSREVTDPVAGEGPVRGVMTALDAIDTERTVVTTCDMPYVQASHLARLADTIAHRPDAGILMLTRGELHPFPLAARKSASRVLAAHFDSGARSMKSLLDVNGAVALPAPADWPDEVWTNLNTPGDLAAFTDGR